VIRPRSPAFDRRRGGKRRLGRDERRPWHVQLGRGAPLAVWKTSQDSFEGRKLGSAGIGAM